MDGISNPAGPVSWANDQDHRNYLQRIAESGGVNVLKVGGSYIATRPGLNLVQGSGVTISATENAGANQVDVTISATVGGLTFPLTVSQGGTGRSTLTSGAVLVGAGTGAVTMLAAGSAGQVLGIVGGVPAWVTIDGGTP